MRLRLAGATFLTCLLNLLSAGASAEPTLPPSYQGIYQPHGVDEIGWWREMDESERGLAASNLVIHDEKLTAYLKQILCDTVGKDRCDAVRIYVMREPTSNASMTANGTMRVFSGLLLRMRSESELAAILGHEFGHFEARHTLVEWKKRRSGSDLLAWASVLVSLAPSYSMYQSYRDINFSVYGNLYRFGRDQEREADRLGIAYLNNSPLQPQAAASVWKNRMAEIEASTRVRGLKKPNFNAIAFTASHPPNQERATYLAELAAPQGATRDEGAARYRANLAPWLPIFLEDQVKLNDFGASDFIIESLATHGWTAELWFARGELYRTRGNQRDLAHAADFYAQAIALNPAAAQAYRGLGLSLMKLARPSEGQQALRTYLDLKPDASDADLIRMMLPKQVTAQ